jgi:hypothetical protein
LPIDLKHGVRIGIEPPKNVQCASWKKKQCNCQSTHGCTEREKRRKPAMSSRFFAAAQN